MKNSPPSSTEESEAPQLIAEDQTPKTAEQMQLSGTAVFKFPLAKLLALLNQQPEEPK